MMFTTKLIDYAEKPEGGREKPELMFARAQISKNHNQITRVFLRRLGSYYSELSSTNPSFHQDSQEQNSTSFSLVEDDVLEENVAMVTIQQRAETEFNGPLWSLGQRMSLLMGGEKIAINDLPMTPGNYCKALRESLAMSDITLTAKLYLYKLFGRWYMPKLANVYERANGLLKSQSVLPNLRLMLEKSGSDRYTGAAPRQNMSGRMSMPVEKYEMLLNDIEVLQGRLGGKQRPTTEYSVDQLLQATDKLQQLTRRNSEQLLLNNQQIQAQDIKAENERLKAQLQGVLGCEDEPQLNTLDIKTIDLVGMLFEYMLNDDQLPDCVKAVLSYLHTPFLKIAFADSGFFRQHEHPARLLLNVLADAGVRWVANDGSSEYKVFERIRFLVKQVMDEFDNDVKLFASLLVEFRAYVQKIELRVQLMEKRATEKARGEDRLREVNRRVNSEIRQRVQKRELPSAILLFLLQPWSDYMAFLLLRYGDQSESWHQALSLIEDLLWGLDISAESGDHVRWRQHYPWVEATMQKGFELIGYDRGKGIKLKRSIDKVFEQRASSHDVTVDDSELLDKLVKLSERRLGNVHDEERLAIKEQEILEKLCLMEFGTWFEFSDGRREKVAWFNANTKHFLFVDQGGKRTGILAGDELARAIIAGDMRMIIGSAKPLVERTLESIYSDLNERAQAQGV